MGCHANVFKYNIVPNYDELLGLYDSLSTEGFWFSDHHRVIFGVKDLNDLKLFTLYDVRYGMIMNAYKKDMINKEEFCEEMRLFENDIYNEEDLTPFKSITLYPTREELIKLIDELKNNKKGKMYRKFIRYRDLIRIAYDSDNIPDQYITLYKGKIYDLTEVPEYDRCRVVISYPSKLFFNTRQLKNHLGKYWYTDIQKPRCKFLNIDQDYLDKKWLHKVFSSGNHLIWFM